MSTIVNTIQKIIHHELRRLRVNELGLVEEVYPHRSAGDDDNYGCDVRLKNSGLLLKRVPVATGHIGTAAIPNVGDLVLVAFDKGDVNQPVIIGRLYNDEDRPPPNDSNEVIFRLPLAEADDRTIMAAIRNLADASPPREILIEMPPKVALHVTDGAVRATAGQTEMELDQRTSGGGKVTIVAGGTQITLDQDGDVTVVAAGSMSLRATGDLSLEGQNVRLAGQLSAEVSAGTDATVNGNLSATLNGAVSATVQGATVSIKGLTSFSP